MSCNLCQNTGFYRGAICSCITGKKELPPELRRIFGDVFRDKKQDAERGKNCQEK